MKQFRKLPILFTPVLISMLAIMLVIASFAWYQVSVGNISSKESSVTISTVAPEGVDVQLSLLGDRYDDTNFTKDNYYYSADEESYKITENKFVGYFGQTGLGNLDSNDYDKPYIVFYQADLISNEENGISLTSAYVNKLEITKSDETLISKEWTASSESEFTIEFYEMSKENGVLTFTNPSSTFEIPANTFEATLYVGIKFYKAGSNSDFLYSSSDYFNSTYSLSVSFE